MLEKILRNGLSFSRLPRLGRHELPLYESLPKVDFTTDNGFGVIKLPANQYRIRLAGNGNITQENWETGVGNQVTVELAVKDEDCVRFFIGPRKVLGNFEFDLF